MKRKCLVAILFLGVALIFVCNSWATDQGNCCCTLTCKYKPIPIINPNPNFTVDKCYNYEDEAMALCNEDTICFMESKNILLYYPINFYIGFEGECKMDLSDCPSEDLLGLDDPGLDILRQFRDEVLSKSEKGKKLIYAYYKYEDVLIKVFEENPGIEDFATELLEKTIERLYTALDNEEELFDDEIAADIDILADELDAVVESPGLKKALRQIKGDMKRGKLF